MPEFTCTVPVPQTPQELEQAIQYYKMNDASGFELFCQWQAIRDAALQQIHVDSELEGDRVPGEDSY